jgi:hypothetical protein
MRSLLVLASTIVLLGGLALATSSEGEDVEGVEIPLGEIYATDAGDPIDVVAGEGDVPGTVCGTSAASATAPGAPASPPTEPTWPGRGCS